MPFNPSHVFLLLKPPPTYKTSLSNNSGIEIFLRHNDTPRLWHYSLSVVVVEIVFSAQL